MKARTRLQIPPANSASSFSIRFGTAGTRENVACFASDRELGLLLPNALKVADLDPLPVSNLRDVAAQFRAIPGARVVEAEIPIEVTQ